MVFSKKGASRSSSKGVFDDIRSDVADRETEKSNKELFRSKPEEPAPVKEEPKVAQSEPVNVQTRTKPIKATIDEAIGIAPEPKPEVLPQAPEQKEIVSLTEVCEELGVEVNYILDRMVKTQGKKVIKFLLQEKEKELVEQLNKTTALLKDLDTIEIYLEETK